MEVSAERLRVAESLIKCECCYTYGMLPCMLFSILNMYRLIVVLSLLALYNSVNIDLTTCTPGGTACCRNSSTNCGNYPSCAGCCSHNITGICSYTEPSICTCCAESDTFCCRGSYKECEELPEFPNCRDCCVPSPIAICTKRRPFICRCGAET